MLWLLLSSLGVLLALTRSVWVGMAVGFVVLTILDRRLRRWLIVGAVALSVAIPIALLSSETLSDQAIGSASRGRCTTAATPTRPPSAPSSSTRSQESVGSSSSPVPVSSSARTTTTR